MQQLFFFSLCILLLLMVVLVLVWFWFCCISTHCSIFRRNDCLCISSHRANNNSSFGISICSSLCFPPLQIAIYSSLSHFQSFILHSSALPSSTQFLYCLPLPLLSFFLYCTAPHSTFFFLLSLNIFNSIALCSCPSQCSEYFLRT